MFEKELENLENRVEALYTAQSDKIPIKDRLLDECITEQTQMQVDWERLVAKAKSVYVRAKSRTELEYATAYRVNLENSKRSLSTTDAKFFAECTTTYVEAKKEENRAYSVLQDAEAVLNAIISRQFSLKDLTNAVIAGVNKHIL